MADCCSYYAGAGDAPSLADESTRGEMDELLILLEEKDADLRRAAELGKCVPSQINLLHWRRTLILDFGWMHARPPAKRSSRTIRSAKMRGGVP